MKTKLALFLSILALSQPILAEDKSNTSTLTDEQKKALNAKYILGDNELPKNWHFIYGPVGKEYKNKSLRFYAPASNGAVEFNCNTNGDINLVFKMIEPNITHVGDVINSNITVGAKQHLLPTVLSYYDSKNMNAIYSASGADVIGMLKVITELPLNIPDTIIIKAGTRQITLPSPNTLNGSKATLALCVMWNNRHDEKQTN